jgi:general secretion pathway protein D
LRTRTPVPRDQLLGILESLLAANDVLMIRGEDDRFLITGSEQAARLSPGVSNPQSDGAGFSTMIIPLRYISAANMAEILAPVAPDTAFVRVDNARNLLMLAGTRAQLDGWLEMVRTFDIDLLEGMSVGLFPLEHSSVEEINAAMVALLGGDSASGNLSDLAHLVRIIPINRLNSILVVTPRAHYLDRIGLWIERLDTTPDANFEKRLYVYEVQNTTSTRLAKLLTSIYSGGGSEGVSVGIMETSVQGLVDEGVAPGLSQETLGDSASSGGGSALAQGLPGSTGGGAQMFSSKMVASGSGRRGSVIDDVRVVADDENNALMIYATGRQYDIIQTALLQLDVVATQVIIEASILEVQLTDELKYGLEWTFKNGLGSDYDGVGLLAAAAGGPAAVVPGFSYTVTNSIGDISAVLNALSSASLINIISTPSVMVLDNHTAYIHVGDQVPTFDQQVETDGGRITQSVTYRDTGVKLTVKPSVNAGGLVTMDVEQSVTDVGEIDSATGQRAFLERNIMSRVAVRSNESVVLGGLIRENATSGSSGVPFLHKLPVVGGLFGTVEDSDRRTELLVIITPRALYNESELREVSREMRSQVRHMELIEVPPK